MVKYRTTWNKAVLEKVRKQVKSLKEIVLVSIFANASNPRNFDNAPSRFIRCCALRWKDGGYFVERRTNGALQWTDIEAIEDDENLWWSLPRLDQKFAKLSETKEERTLLRAIESLKGILNV